MEDDDWERAVAAVWENEAATAEERISSLRALARLAPHAALGEFELGGAYDAADLEAEAERHYRAAAALGLAAIDPSRAAQLVVQHASTLRNLGRFDEAITMLERAPDHPATGRAPAAFLALALHSAGRVDEALRTALEALAPELPRYRASVRAYAAALTGDSPAADIG